MKTYNIVGSTVKDGIPVSLDPYPHIVLGEGGHKRTTWIPLGKRDANDIIVRSPAEGAVGVAPATVSDVSVIALNDTATRTPNGKYLIVAPRSGVDDRVLVLWRVSSGYRGSAGIYADEGVTVIAKDSSWHSGQGSLGVTAEILAILKPGQELRASISGRRVQSPRAKLVYDDRTITVTNGGEEMDVDKDDKVEGDVL